MDIENAQPTNENQLIKKPKKIFTLHNICSLILCYVIITLPISWFRLYTDCFSDEITCIYTAISFIIIPLFLIRSVIIIRDVDSVIVKHKKYYYYADKESIEIDYQNSWYEPFRLFQSKSKSINFMLITYSYLPILLTSVSTSFMIFYSDEDRMNVILSSIFMSSTHIIPLIYGFILPVIFGIIDEIWEIIKCCCLCECNNSRYGIHTS